jgi:hypothetical protein
MTGRCEYNKRFRAALNELLLRTKLGALDWYGRHGEADASGYTPERLAAGYFRNEVDAILRVEFERPRTNG